MEYANVRADSAGRAAARHHGRTRFRSHTRCVRTNNDGVDQNRDLVNHLRFHHLQILSDRSAGPRTTESPHRSTPVRLHTGEHRSLLTDSGDPRTPPKYPYAWSAVCGQAALTGSAGRRIDLRPRDACTSRDNLSSISIIHIDTTRGKMLMSK